MGYSESVKAIERVRVVFDVIANNSELKRITIPSQTPRKLAYAIFEAFKYCERHNTHPEYIAIKRDYKVKEVRDGVIFEPRIGLQLEQAMESLKESKAVVEAMTIPHITTVMEIVGACIKHSCTITFPDAQIESDIVRLKNWALKNNYTISERPPLTMTKHAATTQDDSVKYG